MSALLETLREAASDLHTRRIHTSQELQRMVMLCQEHGVNVTQLQFYRWLYLTGRMHD